jgi:DNA-binding GntR family transcriptional regulator
MEIAPLPEPTLLAESAYERLRDAIFSGAIPPGARLSVPTLAARLGVSRSPVREAIARLCQERLARDEPRRGAVVAMIGPGELAALYEVRAALEGVATRLAVEHGDADFIAQLKATLAEHQQAVDTNSWEGHQRADAQFHSRIRHAAGNDELLRVLDSIQARVRLGMLTTSVVSGPAQALEDHRSIYDAIERRDADAAERRAKAHIERLRDVLLRAVATAAAEERASSLKRTA